VPYKNPDQQLAAARLRAKRWRAEHPDAAREYQREYMKTYMPRRRAAQRAAREGQNPA
jgi:hypothetical protein